MAARRFLWLIVAGVGLVVLAVAAYTLFGPGLIRFATTPRVAFRSSPQAPAPAYVSARPEVGGRTAPDMRAADARAWLARPGQPSTAAWTPPGTPAPAVGPRAAVFYVAPTAWLSPRRWNAPLDDAATNARLGVYLLVQASAFNGVGDVWAPAYRQATFGAFLTRSADATAALDLAYADVARAWDAFLAANPDGPIIVAGHSQGSLHLIRLLHERIRGSPAARRIVAAYVPGWPVSTTADLPALGLPACARADEAGCLLSWLSFADPADAREFLAVYARTPGWTGAARTGTVTLCVNPVTGTLRGTAGADANLGALKPGATLTELPTLTPRAAPATCRRDGLLSIGAAPDGWGMFILPGNNYHVYDYNLFWANVRADAARRLAAWRVAHPA